MERDNSVRPTEVDHLQRCSQIFQSDETELVRSISNRNFRNFGLNGKRPSISMAAWIQPVNCCRDCERRWFFKTLKGGSFLVLFALTFSFNFSHSPAMMITPTGDSSAMHAGCGSVRLGQKLILIDLILFWFHFNFLWSHFVFIWISLDYTFTCLLIQN